MSGRVKNSPKMVKVPLLSSRKVVSFFPAMRSQVSSQNATEAARWFPGMKRSWLTVASPTLGLRPKSEKKVG
jgi:hypothetical protein